MIRRIVTAAVLLPLLALLVACNAGSDIVVKPDGSGTYSTLITVEGPAGDALYDSAVKAAAKSGVPLKVTRYSAGTESGAKITCTFRSLADLDAMAAKLSGQKSGLGGVQVSRGKAGWSFLARAEGGLTRPPGTSETGAPGGDIDAGKLGGLIHLSVAVELPGAPGTTNATAVTHTATTSRFSWDLDVGREATDLQASTTFVGDQGSVELASALTPLGEHSDGGDGWSAARVTVVLVVVVVVVLLALAAVLLVRRRRRTVVPVVVAPAVDD